jgi:hypothetical protein
MCADERNRRDEFRWLGGSTIKCPLPEVAREAGLEGRNAADPASVRSASGLDLGAMTGSNGRLHRSEGDENGQARRQSESPIPTGRGKAAMNARSPSDVSPPAPPPANPSGLELPVHRFRTLCRNAGISKEVSDYLTSHGEGDVASRYGEYEVPMLRDNIERIAAHRMTDLSGSADFRYWPMSARC